MPGPIAYAAIALQARDRLRQIRDALKAKERNGRTVNFTERQVRYLAERAFDIMTAAQPAISPPPVRLYGPSLGEQVSKFVAMGAVGPDLTGYAALFAEGQSWLRDTLHKGTPDVNREQVLASSCNLVLSFWNKVQPLIAQEFSDPKEAEAKKKLMQGYVLGHVCHIAADIVSTPYIDQLEFKLGRTTAPARPKLARKDIVAAIDTATSRTFFGRGNTTRGNDWVDWWPSFGQVPDSFYKAYKQALEETYGAGAVRKGLGSYEKSRHDAAPPELSEKLLKDGFETFRTVVDTGVAWDFWDWLGATWLMFLPSFLALPFALTLPNGKDYFRDTKPAGYDDDKAAFEIVALPFAVNSLVPVIYGIIATRSYLGAESEVVFEWVSAGVQVAAAIAYFASLGASKESLPWRWVLIFALPLIVEVVQIFFTAFKGISNQRRRQLFVSVFLSPLLSLLFILLYRVLLHKGVERITDPPETREAGDFVGDMFAWFFILVGLWWLVTAILRWSARDVPTEQPNPLVTGGPHYIRLFDDTTLYSQPRGTSPTLADLFYPSGRRELLKLWWNAPAGAPTLKSQRDRLLFDFGGGAAGLRTIFAPAAPTKLSEFAAYLERTVKNNAGEAKLKTKLFFADVAEEDYELPPGLAFSDDGDGATTEEAHNNAAAAATAIGGDEAHAYVLYHAPKAQQSVLFSRTGAVPAEGARAAVAGAGNLAVDAANALRLTVGGAGASRFSLLFRPGDAIESPIGGAKRVVVSIESDSALIIATPFPALGATWGRAALDRRVDEAAPAAWNAFSAVPAVGVRTNDIQANAATQFGALFRPGDTIRVTSGGASQERKVVAVSSDRQMRLDAPLDPAVAAPPGGTITRVADEAADGVQYLADADDTLFTGETLMNQAADLAALLCLGATSQLMSDADRGRRDLMGNAPNDLRRVFQVFRNWNLDRRRVNEWKMLVLGGAVSEGRGALTELDPAVPPLPAGATPQAVNGEATARQLGWVNLLRSWVEMASSPAADTHGTSAHRPGNPANVELSRGIAYLLDLNDPVPTPVP